MPLKKIIQKIDQNSGINLIDRQFGKFILELAKSSSVDLFLTAVLVSVRMRYGHSCLDLRQLENQPYQSDFENIEGFFPKYENWKTLLENSQVVISEGSKTVVVQENSSPNYAPLVLSDNHLYLYRYWFYEKTLADLLKKRLQQEPLLFPEKVSSLLDRYFPGNSQEIDWQKIVIMGAILKKFCMISGSPGTGKTSTVVKLLAVLIEYLSTSPIIRVAAPTGKAAQRLQESILENKQKLHCSESFKNLIPEEVFTIHRLLGYSPNTHLFRHDTSNPLPVDILVIDEASMIDLALMTQLVSALRPNTRLILLGDKHQLSSVEACWVFGDLCETKKERGYSKDFLSKLQKFASGSLPDSLASEVPPGIQDSVMELYKSYRFRDESGIKILSQSIIEGQEEKAIEALNSRRYSDILWTSLPETEIIPPYHLLRDRILEGFREYLSVPNTNIKDIFRAFSRFRILCGLTKKEMGVESMNRLVEMILKEAQLIESDRMWYRGRPVMITHNDYSLQLFNGDIGITLSDSVEGSERVKVYFPEAQGTYRSFLPHRLPEHETAFATTVHKSQGSEFERVLFLLPLRLSPIPMKDSLTRELVYTAITRAKTMVEIFGKESILRHAIQRRTNRTSGLKERLISP